MKVLGICGSPRKDANTEIALREALKIIEEQGIETELVTLAGKKIEFCNHCNACKTGPCPIKDDVPEILEKMVSSDAIIIASPTYFGNVTAQLKALMDRTLPLRRQGMKLRNKIGGAIATGATRNGGQEHVCSAIHNFMLLHEMIVVSDTVTAHFGGIALGGHEEKVVLSDEKGLETVKNLGRRIADLLNSRRFDK
ncbi:MAG: flavodoxin family protein [Spirochaetes bacterium]|nr:MAG: flavodoxin family protein [Spirochaetota bacterium]